VKSTHDILGVLIWVTEQDLSSKTEIPVVMTRSFYKYMN
jgi:hypothetical protein